MLKLKPLLDNLHVAVDIPVEKTEGGILLPKSAQASGAGDAVLGTVIALGPGRKVDGQHVPIDGIKVGSRIVFGEYAGTQVDEIGDQTYRIISESEVLAVDGDEMEPG